MTSKKKKTKPKKVIHKLCIWHHIEQIVAAHDLLLFLSFYVSNVKEYLMRIREGS